MGKPLPITKSYSIDRARELTGGQYKKQQEAKLREASKMYETQFLNEMVRAMRKTVQHSQMSEPSFAEKIFQDQLFDKYVETWGDQGGVGIGDMIYNQIHERIFPNTLPPPQGPLPLNSPTNGSQIPIKDREPSSFKVNPPKLDKPGEISFLFQKHPKALVGGTEVSSPWSGTISKVGPLTNERKYFEITHEKGVISQISFVGELKKMQLNQTINAGETLGKLSEEALGLSWKIQA